MKLTMCMKFQTQTPLLEFTKEISEKWLHREPPALTKNQRIQDTYLTDPVMACNLFLAKSLKAPCYSSAHLEPQIISGSIPLHFRVPYHLITPKESFIPEMHSTYLPFPCVMSSLPSVPSGCSSKVADPTLLTIPGT